MPAPVHPNRFELRGASKKRAFKRVQQQALAQAATDTDSSDDAAHVERSALTTVAQAAMPGGDGSAESEDIALALALPVS